MGYIRNSLAVVDDISSTGINTLSQGSLVHIVNGGGASLYSLNKDITSPSMSVEQAIENGSLGTLHTETFQVTNDASIGNSDTNLKSCKLLDFSSKNGFCTSEFILQIERENNIIVANIKAKYFSNNIEVYVSEVFCNNYAYYSQNSMFYNYSLFKDTALLGCILSVEDNNKLILNILNSGTQTTTNVSTQHISGNTFPHPMSYSRSGTYINNNDIINIPFKDGASNTFLGCGQIYTYFTPINYVQAFKNGLYKLGSPATLNPFIYPSLQKVTGANNLYEVNNRYLVQDKSSRYISQSLPNIKGNTGSMYRSDVGSKDFCLLYNEYANNKNYSQGKGWDGAFSLSNRNSSQISGLNIGQGSQGKDFSAQDLIGISFNANSSNPIYQDGANVKPNSVQVQYYIKLF